MNQCKGANLNPSFGKHFVKIQIKVQSKTYLIKSIAVFVFTVIKLIVYMLKLTSLIKPTLCVR